MIKLYDCCWVELEGDIRPQLAIRQRLKPAIYGVGQWVYAECGSPLPHNPEAPRILDVFAPDRHGRRRAG